MIYGTIVENESRGSKDVQIARFTHRVPSSFSEAFCLRAAQQWVNNARPRFNYAFKRVIRDGARIRSGGFPEADFNLFALRN